MRVPAIKHLVRLHNEKDEIPSDSGEHTNTFPEDLDAIKRCEPEINRGEMSTEDEHIKQVNEKVVL